MLEKKRRKKRRTRKEKEEEDPNHLTIFKGRKPQIQIITWNLLIASVLAAN